MGVRECFCCCTNYHIFAVFLVAGVDVAYLMSILMFACIVACQHYCEHVNFSPEIVKKIDNAVPG
jgi:hypothetical protein